MHGSPCQDFSVAGKNKGGDEGSNTRSSLMYETIRIVKTLKPKYIVWENVKNLLSKKHKHNFDNYIQALNDLGYNSYYQVLNAKDYGIPQNRERVFTISIRKDIDEGSFLFPEKEELKLKLKDLLENEVDEKYFLNAEMISKIRFSDDDLKQIGTLNIKGLDCIKRVYSSEGISPTLTDMQGGNRQPKILEINGINKIEIPQLVKVRKYPVDTEKLKLVLREAKLEKDTTNEWIAMVLDVPETTVEHWFRKDNSFSIPAPEIWFELKRFLEIETDEFDESITTFEEKEGVYEKSNRYYLDNGISPTITSASANEKIVTGFAEIGDGINLSYPSTPKKRIYKGKVRTITTKGHLQGVFTE